MIVKHTYEGTRLKFTRRTCVAKLFASKESIDIKDAKSEQMDELRLLLSTSVCVCAYKTPVILLFIAFSSKQICCVRISNDLLEIT